MANDQPDAPRQIGRYAILRLLGEGGFGTVWLAFDDDLNRKVAIKVPRVERLSSDEGVTQFLNEARSAANLRHPGIVAIHDVGRLDDGRCYVIMEYVEGCTLADRLRNQRISQVAAAEIMAGVAEAAHYAHEHGLVHRDLKPANILLDGAGKPRIADFGLAVNENVISLSACQADRAGTPAYMSPEQFGNGPAPVDRRTDLWSLGVIFYEMLTGVRPFRDQTGHGLVYEILNWEPTPPRSVDPTIPVELEAVCMRCLAKLPAQRYGSANQVARELKAILTRWLPETAHHGTSTAARIGQRAHQLVAQVHLGQLGCGLTVTLASFLLLAAIGIWSQVGRYKSQKPNANPIVSSPQDAKTNDAHPKTDMGSGSTIVKEESSERSRLPDTEKETNGHDQLTKTEQARKAYEAALETWKRNQEERNRYQEGRVENVVKKRGGDEKSPDGIPSLTPGLPDRLSSQQLDPDTGLIKWPEVLLRDEFAPERAALAYLFAERATRPDSTGLGTQNYREVRRVTDDMHDILRSLLDLITPDEFILGNRFLNSVSFEARFEPGFSPARVAEEKANDESKMAKASPEASGDGTRLPVPDDEAQKDARKEMQEKLGNALKGAQTPEQKRTLAQELAQDRVVKDKAYAYVVLKQAIDLAEAAGEVELAWQIAGQLAKTFAVDDMALRNQSLAEIGKSAKSPEAAWQLTDAASRLMRMALLAGDAAAVKKAGSQAQGFAKRTGDQALQKDVIGRATDAGKLAAELEAVAAARETLKTAPEDPRANFTVGYFELCAVGDIDTALPKLAKGSDKGWKKLAAEELAVDSRLGSKQVADAERALAVADAWWSRADDVPWPGKHYLRMRAAGWYGSAYRSLAGTSGVRAAERLKLLLATDDGFPHWELFNGGSGERNRDVVRLENGGSLETAVEYEGALDVTLVARTTGTDLRLSSHNWIWGWKVKVVPNVWHTVRFVITPSSRTAFVDGVPLENDAWETPRELKSAPISVYVVDVDVVEIKKFIVKATD